MRVSLWEVCSHKTFDYSDVTIRRCLAGGASPVPSPRVGGGGFLKELEGQRFTQAVLDRGIYKPCKQTQLR